MALLVSRSCSKFGRFVVGDEWREDGCSGGLAWGMGGDQMLLVVEEKGK
jgi:hypothetical protein